MLTCTGFLKNLRKLPRETRQMPLARVLDEKMKQFKESLPLFMDLKNEALRERHWKELMNKTGQKFDINPESFTLAAVFAMELHRFQDVINEIVGAAQKELSIAKVLLIFSPTGIYSYGLCTYALMCRPRARRA